MASRNSSSNRSSAANAPSSTPAASSASDAAAGSNESREAGDDTNSKQSRRDFRTYTRTYGRAFVNALVRQARGDRDPLYFAKVGMLTGRQMHAENGKNTYRDRVQFLDLLVGGHLKTYVEKQFAAVALDYDDESRITLDKKVEGYTLDGVLFQVEIHDLHFFAEVSDPGSDRAYLNNNGVLAGLSLTPFEGD